MDSKREAGESSRPIVLYVSGVEAAKLTLTHPDTVTGIDAEFSRDGAVEMIKLLADRLKDDGGAIRVRLLGHLVIG
jgi:hypothetical protein